MHDSFQNIPPPSAFLCSSGEMPAHIGGSVPEGQSGFGSGSTDAALPVCSLQAEPGETLLAEGCVLKSTDLESGMLD